MRNDFWKQRLVRLKKLREKAKKKLDGLANNSKKPFMKKMNIYLDIDGVLISDAIESYGQPAEYVLDFLKFITEHHNCYWLTTHCMNGENHTKEFLQKKLPAEVMQYVELIKPLDWKQWKTEAIDFSKDFCWIDDDLYEPEKEMLQKHNCEDKLIKVNLRKNPNQLKDILGQL